MIKKLVDHFYGRYDIEYTAAYDVVIHTKIRLKDFLYVRNYLKSHGIYYRNLIVESW